MIDWKIGSWRKLPIKQVPEYSDMDRVSSVEQELSVRPPLVSVSYTHLTLPTKA